MADRFVSIADATTAAKLCGFALISTTDEVAVFAQADNVDHAAELFVADMSSGGVHEDRFLRGLASVGSNVPVAARLLQGRPAIDVP